MLCAQCLLFGTELPSTTQVNGLAVCTDHARAMLLGAPVHPVAPGLVARLTDSDIAPRAANHNPPFPEQS